ncbi:MAG: MBL fold metallo-hydrolase [Solirubrobacterales bacterium]|nr:MBL fold metallo-hydrolase [Solirubrobacterales bacterium]
MSHPSRPDSARADRIVPGVWRLRLPLPWAATPHGNAYAVSAGDGVVLFDTGYGGSEGIDQLELGLKLAGFRLDDVKMIACTHAHADHYGCAATIVERVGCPLWIHPAWGHVRTSATDPEGALEARLDAARLNGVPEPIVEQMAEMRRSMESGFDGAIGPDVELVDGVEVETDLGTWRTHEAPGHAPSHVVFHLPERQILLSGDQIVGRVFLYFDQGHTPDPVGEFLTSLDAVDSLGSRLCLSGHGRPFRDIPRKTEANREQVGRQLDGVRAALADGPRTPFEIISAGAGTDSPEPQVVGYGLEMTLAYLTHLERLGEALKLDDAPATWGLTN